MLLTRVTAPAETPVPLSLVKAHCRIDHDDEDLLLQHYLDAAVSYLDGYSGVLGRCMVTQTWRADITRVGEVIALPFPDIQVTTADFTDATAGALVYEWHESMAFPALIPTGGFGRPASVTFTAGYGGPDDVPAALKDAILMLTLHRYDMRAPVVEGNMNSVPLGFDAMIAPFRVQRV